MAVDYSGVQKSLDDINNYSAGISGQRQQGVDKIKTDTGYTDRLRNLESVDKQILDTNRALQSVDEDTQNRTNGRIVTQAQLNGLTNNARMPISKNLMNFSQTRDSQQTGLDRVNSQIQDWTTNFNNDANTNLQTKQGNYAALFNKYKMDTDAEAQRQAQAQASSQAAWQQKILQEQIDAQKKAQQAAAPTVGGKFTGEDGINYEITSLDKNGNPAGYQMTNDQLASNGITRSTTPNGNYNYSSNYTPPWDDIGALTSNAKSMWNKIKWPLTTGFGASAVINKFKK